MRENNVTENIKRFLKSKQREVNNSNPSPIIVRWLESTDPEMRQSLEVINTVVGYLLTKKGGVRKLKQWLLAGDKNFNSITAERYIIRYLQSRNGNLVDNLHPDGVDAQLKIDNTDVGIEVTTLNGDVGTWVLSERLKQYLVDSDFLRDKGIEITYSQRRISDETKGRNIDNYIRKAGEAIIANDNQAMSKLGLSIEFDIPPGWISWRIGDTDSFIWFRSITEELFPRLQEKAKQLMKYPRNLVFVGLNHSAPPNGIFPRIFEDIRKAERESTPEIQEIKDYWASCMARLTNVIGICYFFYSLERVNPFYPLKIFWRSEEDKVNINL